MRLHRDDALDEDLAHAVARRPADEHTAALSGVGHGRVAADRVQVAGGDDEAVHSQFEHDAVRECKSKASREKPSRRILPPMDDSIRTGRERVPPGQYVTDKWPVLTYGLVP